MDNQALYPGFLDLPISFFKYDNNRGSFANVPAHQTTLRRIIKTNYYREQIELVRAETDEEKQKELKKYLPAITPASLLYHRKRDTTFAEKIQQQWPVMMGDVDRKDNPSLDMAELKKHIARLPYILLCACSVRGGLWFVVRLPDNQTPESLAAHFRHLQKLFSEKFGIVLDTTKGGNPTDLRFVSYDSDPYINENATIMSGAYTPPKPKPKPTQNYSQARINLPDEGQLLTRLVNFTQGAGEGQRHITLLKAAKLAGGWVAAGRMDEQNALYALETVASEWPTFIKSQKTIRDGIRYGLTSPVHAEELPSPVPKSYCQLPKPLYSTLAVSSIKTISQDTRPCWVLNGETIYGDVLTVEPCDDFPAEWDTLTPPPISNPLTNSVDFKSGVSRPVVNGFPRIPLAFDALFALRRIRWCVIPEGIAQEDYNPNLPTLIPSPNRERFAHLLGLTPDQLPLYQIAKR